MGHQAEAEWRLAEHYFLLFCFELRVHLHHPKVKCTSKTEGLRGVLDIREAGIPCVVHHVPLCDGVVVLRLLNVKLLNVEGFPCFALVFGFGVLWLSKADIFIIEEVESHRSLLIATN